MAAIAGENPNYGIGDPGGSFVGIGAMTRACNVPNALQPTIPGGGLLGPDGYVPIWSNPGYDITPPVVSGALPGGFNPTMPPIMPFYPPSIDDLTRDPNGDQSLENAPGYDPFTFTGYAAGSLIGVTGYGSGGYSSSSTTGTPGSGSSGGLGSPAGASQTTGTNGDWDSSGAPRTPDGTYYAPGYVPGGSNPELDKDWNDYQQGRIQYNGFGITITTEGAEYQEEVNTRIQEQSSSYLASVYALTDAEKDALAEQIAAGANVWGEQTDEEWDIAAMDNIRQSIRPWTNFFWGMAIVGSLGAVSLSIGVYYGAIAGSRWAMSIAGRSWLMQRIAPYFLRRRFLKKGVQLYRLHNTGYRYRSSWALKHPDYYQGLHRKFYGLPNSNLEQHLTTGTLQNTYGVNVRFAKPLDGNCGGAIEFVLRNPSRQIANARYLRWDGILMR